MSRASSIVRARRNTVQNIQSNPTDLNHLHKDKNDQLSVITHDRLKKFNEIQGTVAGNAHEEIAAQEMAMEEQAKKEDGDQEHDEEEQKDTVSAMKQEK